MTPTFVLLFAFLLPADTLAVGTLRFDVRPLDLGPGEVNLAAADVDRDGRPDLVAVSSEDGLLRVFRSRGDGRFDAPRGFDAGANPTHVEAADLNSDGRVDFVVANHETGYLTAMLAEEDGFRSSRIRIDVDPHPHVVRAFDVDGNGTLDLVTDDRNRGGLLVLYGTGSGQFGRSRTLVATGGDPYLGFHVGDLNGDGKGDFVTPNPDHTGLTLSRGDGWHEPRRIRTTAPFGVAVADFDGDGVPDLLAASGEGGSDVEFRAGPGFEGRPERIPMDRGPKLIAVGDLNGDGIRDATVCTWSGQLLLVLGGRGSLETHRVSWAGNSWGLLLADFNGDGLDDVVVADGSSRRGEIFLSLR